MADKEIGTLTPATLPLARTESVHIVQAGNSRRVTLSDIDARQNQAKAAGYTAVYADMASMFRFTATATLALTAAATLGANWWCEVKADGGTVTIDPNGSELINGASTYTVYNGQSATIACDDTGFQVISMTGVEEHIRTQTFTAASDVTFTGLSAYRILFASLYATVSVDNEVVYAQTSVSGTFSTPVGGYNSQTIQSFSTTVNAINQTGMRITAAIGNADPEAGIANATFFEFNQAKPCFFVSDSFVLNQDASLPVKLSIGGSRVDSSARDGLRFIPGSGTISGFITLKGIRG